MPGGVVQAASAAYTAAQCPVQDELEFVEVRTKTYHVGSSTTVNMSLSGHTPRMRNRHLATINCSGLDLVSRVDIEAGPHPRADEWMSHAVHLHLTPQFSLRFTPIATSANNNALRPVRCTVTVPLPVCLFDREGDSLEQLHVAHRSRFALLSKLHTFQRHSGTLRESATLPAPALDAQFELTQVAPGDNEMALVKQTPTGSGEGYSLSQDKSVVLVYNTNIMQLVISFIAIALSVGALLLSIIAFGYEGARRAHEYNVGKLNAAMFDMWKMTLARLTATWKLLVAQGGGGVGAGSPLDTGASAAAAGPATGAM